jgi:hypothetical protein
MAKYEIKRLLRLYESGKPVTEGKKKYLITSVITKFESSEMGGNHRDYVITFKETRDDSK